MEVYYDGYRPTNTPLFHPNSDYQKAIPEIEVFGVKVRANPPENEPLKEFENFYCLDPFSCCFYSPYQWRDDLYDVTALKNKAIWKNESDIQAVVKALKGDK